MANSKLPGELTWPKLLGTSLAAVLAAWLAGYLGLGNTMTGIAIGSIVATFGSAFFTHTIDKTHQTILVRTDRGTVIETRGDSDVEGNGDHTAVLPVPPAGSALPNLPEPNATPSRWKQIHWRAVVVAALVTMGVTLAAISIYEGAVGRTWGSNEPGTTIGNTVRGGPQPTVEPTAEPTPTEEPTAEPTPTEPTAEPTPTEPTAEPTPTAEPKPTDCPTPATGGDPADAEAPDCPTAEPTDDPGGLLGLNQ